MVLRQLLSLEDISLGFSLEPIYVILCAAVIIVFIMLLVTCVCGEEKQKSGDALVLKQVTPRIDRKEGDQQVASDDVVVNIGAGNSRDSQHSNGDVSTGNDKRASTGSMRRSTTDSKDQRTSQSGTIDRALPAIPMTQAPTEEDDDNYDSINRVEATAKPEGDVEDNTYDMVKDDNFSQDKDDDPYAKVKGDNPYAEVKEVKGAGKKDPPYSKIREHEYAQVTEKQEAASTSKEKKEHPYAKVKDKEHTYAKVKEKEHPYAEVKGHKQARKVNSETGEECPRAVFHEGNDIDSQSSHTKPSTEEETYVPRPPPPVPAKNFDQPDPAVALSPGATAIPSPGLPPRNDDGQNLTVVTNPADPPYTKVTARESLASIREREGTRPDEDFYESVTDAEDPYSRVENREEPPPIPTSERSPLAKQRESSANRGSMTSDWYAEIGADTGFVRNSMYASVDGKNSKAPAPPSIERLKKLPLDNNDEDSVDPGYSKVNRDRPSTSSDLHRRSKSPQGAANVLYAQVDKQSKDNRKTVQTSTRIDSTTNVLYSTVSTNSYDNATPGNGNPPNSPQGAIQSSATMLKQELTGTGVNDLESDPGYQTVQDVSHEINGDGFHPNYDRIPDNQVNFEQAQPMVLVQDPGPTKPYKRREHLYQEIDEARLHEQGIPVTEL